MRNLNLILMGLLMLGIPFLTLPNAQAQRSKMEPPEIVEITAFVIQNDQPGFGAYTVPIGKRLIITDVTVSGLNGDCQAIIQRDSSGQEAVIARSPGEAVPGSTNTFHETWTKTYGTGIGFGEGETVFVRKTGCDVAVFFELRGELRPS